MRFIKILLLIVLTPIALFPGAYVIWICGVTVVEESVLRWQLRGVQAWPTTEAIVEPAESRIPPTWYPWPSRVHCRFHYTWDAQRYTVEQNRFSAHYSFFSTSHDVFRARLKSQLSPQTTKRCHVNPDRPAEALLTETFDDAQLGCILAGACFGVVLGLGMLTVGGLLGWALAIWAFPRPEKPQAGAAGRLDAHYGNGRILLPLAAWFSVGVIPMALLTVPALLRGEPHGSYWILVALQAALPMPFWVIGLRHRRSAPLIKDSWLALDGRPIHTGSPPAGRLFLAPTTDYPPELAVKVELIKSAGKHSATLWKRRYIAHYERSSDGLGGGCYSLPPIEMNIDLSRYGFRLMWAITAKGRTRGRRFSLCFSHFV